MDIELGHGGHVNIGEPIVVALADPGETRWGRHQFVRLSNYPEDKILLRYHAGADSVNAYGSEAPTFISDDRGDTWNAFETEGFPGAGFPFPTLNNGFMCIPGQSPLKLEAEKLSMPEPVGKYFSYRDVFLYRVDQCPKPVQDYLSKQPCVRWHPNTKQWTEDYTCWDIQQRLIWIAQGEEAGQVSGTWTEHMPVQIDQTLLYADYRAQYLAVDGTVPRGCNVACMISVDNGQTWQRKSSIVDPDAMPGSISNMTEPVLAVDVNSNLVCVIRRADQEQKSMLITYSHDRGQTWEGLRPLEELGSFGVFPHLITLDCGLMVLSYGRPGVYLSFSMDGTGRQWEKPMTILKGDPAHLSSKTDGYTEMLPIGPNEFILAYTDFDYVDNKNRKRKSVLVRRIKVNL